MLDIIITTSSSSSSSFSSNISSHGDEKDEFEYTNRIAVQYVWTTVPIVFLIFGTISNILSITVFMRREMRKYSSFVYFGILNIINLALIYVTILRIILQFNFKFDLRSNNIATCKLHVFLTYFLGHLSSFLICTISIDRVISVVFLNKAKLLCTPRIALIVTLCLAFLNFFISSHFLFFESAFVDSSTNSTNTTKEIQCEPPNGTVYYSFIDNAWKIIDMSIFALIPFVIMSICSVIIIIRVAKQSEKVRVHKNREIKSLLSKTVNNNNNNNNNLQEKAKNEESVRNLSKMKNRNKSEKKFSSRTRNLALMLIPVNILFLVFLAPVVMTMYFYKNVGRDMLTIAITELLAMCNYTFNFIIYFLTSSKFREELCKFFNEILLIFTKNSDPLRGPYRRSSRN